MRKRKLITFKEAAEILCLAERTIRNKKADTENLTWVRRDGITKLIEYEVLKHLDDLIEKSTQG